MNDTVIIEPTSDDPASAALRVVERLGGMHAILAGRKVAILKPNFVAGRAAATGATTDLRIIGALARAVRAAGATPLLCEFPGTEFDVGATFAILGIEDFAREHALEIVRRVERWETIRPVGAHLLRHYRVPAELTGAALINVPVLKTHVISTMSLGLKNLMGLLHLDDRRTMHARGIDRSIVDMSLGLRPDLTIIDGTVGQHGDGPLYGHPAHVGALVGGRDPLAVDFAACALVGVDPDAVGHLRMASVLPAAATARRAASAIDVLVRFELPRPRTAYRAAFRGMFLFDYPFFALTRKRLARAVYESGLVGTRPVIRKAACTSCNACVDVCPVPQAIDIARFRIDYAVCERCLLCVDACGDKAIDVLGMSGARAAHA